MNSSLDCKSIQCGPDAGCKKNVYGLYICICAHDLSEKKGDEPCPRRIATSIPSNRTFVFRTSDQDQRTLIIRTTQLSPTLSNQSSGDFPATSSLLNWLVPVACFIAFLGLPVLIIMLRRIRARQKSPIQFRHDPLKIEHFVINTAYGSQDFLENEVNNDTITSQSLILLRESIELQEEIGEGCFGKVYLGRLRCPNSVATSSSSSYINVDNREKVAVKVLKVSSIGSTAAVAQEELLREAKIMAEFSHENILSLRGVVFNESNIGPWIVFEYMELGDLVQLLRSVKETASSSDHQHQRICFNTVNLTAVATQIANGMNYLSSRGFVHRDLACRNCLVGEKPNLVQSTSGRSNLIVKISDFGMSRDLHASDYYKTKGSQLLPVRWMAPESLLYGKFSLQSDVWSFGVVLWEIFSMGAIPYYGHSNEEVVNMIVDNILLKSPVSAPTAVIEIMLEGCWKKEPSSRFSFKEIYEKISSCHQTAAAKEMADFSTYLNLN